MIQRSLVAFALLAVAFCGCTDSSKKVAAKPEEPPQQKAVAPPAPRINPMTHIAAGQMLERQGDINGAIEQFEKAVAADPKNSVGFNHLGIAYQKLGRFSDAEQMFAQGIAVHPGSAMIHNNLGYTYLMQNKLPEAEQSFRNALAVSPQFQRAHTNLGITLVQTGRIDEGFAEFRRVAPKDVACFNVAVTCAQKGDYTNSEKYLKQALALNPNCPGARQQLDKLVLIGKAQPLAAPPTKPTPLAGDARNDAAGPP